MMEGTDETWVSDEPSFPSVLRLVVSRALRRPARVLAIALLTTAALVASRAYRPHAYLATLHFRLAENELTDPTSTPRPPRAIHDYILNVALSRSRVERIMEEHQWSTAWRARDRVAAVDQFREDIGVEVDQNFFLYDRRPHDAPRSAHVAIWLKGPDATKTASVLHEIGAEILEEQAAYRSARLGQARELVDAELARARARLKSLQERVGPLRLASARADGVRALAIRSQIAALENEVPAAIEQALALQQLAAETNFSAAAENAQLGLTFELFDESLVASPPDLTRAQLARLAAVVFVMALLLTVPVVGAFDDRIYTPEDLVARGLPLFGALPRFPGDDVGSYRARTHG